MRRRSSRGEVSLANMRFFSSVNEVDRKNSVMAVFVNSLFFNVFLFFTLIFNIT